MPGRKLANAIAALLCAAGLLCGCAAVREPVTAPPDPPAVPAESAAPQTETTSAPQEEPSMKHEAVVYFANWHLGNEAIAAGGEVAGIPWDQVTYVNHAFWAVEPADGSTETSFQRRAAGQEARTAFRIVSLNPEEDCGDCGESAVLPGVGRDHFSQYAYFSEHYPQVNILISIGGWTRCGYFSEMAYTPEGRASFIESCLELMRTCPWIDGIDIDWEYPAGSRDGERTPGDDEDQGCPIFGTATQDRENFIALLRELRQAMDEAYGPGVKKLTACASGSTGWTLPCQDWAGAAPWLDLINIMTYDLAGPWDSVTGFASSALLSKFGAMYFKMQDIPLEKLCVGVPLYGSSFRMKELTKNPLGAPVEPVKPALDIDQQQLMAWEAAAVSGYRLVCENGRYAMGEKFDLGGVGWHMDYNERSGAAYLWNDDPEDPCYLWFVSYESPLTLQEKLDYVLEKGIGGIIVWETSQDDASARMLRMIGSALIPENNARPADGSQ